MGSKLKMLRSNFGSIDTVENKAKKLQHSSYKIDGKDLMLKICSEPWLIELGYSYSSSRQGKRPSETPLATLRGSRLEPVLISRF